MTPERIREIGESLREFADFAQGDYIYVSVNVTKDIEYDLGDFGSRSTEVTIEDDEYQLDAEDVMDKYPLSSADMLNLAEELEEYQPPEQPTEKATLASVLADMELNGQAALARAIRSVVDAVDGMVAMAPLVPNKPMPWPGALKDGIDYTAADFPLRYQPPPGFNWVTANYGQGVPPDQAGSVTASTIPEGTQAMVLDRVGRVRWMKTDDRDDYSDNGIRWRVWHLSRDGISEAEGFTGDTPPRAIDENGDLIREPGVDSQFYDDYYQLSDASKKRVAEIRREYGLAAVNEYGVTYDPRTVPLGDIATVNSVLLRVGDQVGGYGRVVRVTKRDDGKYVHTFLNDEGQEVTDTRDSFDWYLRKIVDWEQQTPAFLLSGAVVDYDPLTVPLRQDKTIIKSRELRIGDDIVGLAFGRVIKIENNEIVMIRDEKETRTLYQDDFSWEVQMIDVPDRDSIPAAVDLQLAAA